MQSSSSFYYIMLLQVVVAENATNLQLRVLPSPMYSPVRFCQITWTRFINKARISTSLLATRSKKRQMNLQIGEKYKKNIIQEFIYQVIHTKSSKRDETRKPT